MLCAIIIITLYTVINYYVLIDIGFWIMYSTCTGSQFCICCTHTHTHTHTHMHARTGDDSYGEWIDIHYASDDNDSDNGVHTLELESEDESDDWVEQESESESESEPHSPQYVEDREGGSVPFQDKDEPSTSTGRSAVKKVQFSGGEVEAPKEVLKEVKEQRLQRAADIAQSRVSVL